MSVLQNDRGYTLLESVFQLMVFMIFASISVSMIIWFRDLYNLEKMKEDAAYMADIGLEEIRDHDNKMWIYVVEKEY